jgi:hypothetical protein
VELVALETRMALLEEALLEKMEMVMLELIVPLARLPEALVMLALVELVEHTLVELERTMKKVVVVELEGKITALVALVLLLFGWWWRHQHGRCDRRVVAGALPPNSSEMAT